MRIVSELYRLLKAERDSRSPLRLEDRNFYKKYLEELRKIESEQASYIESRIKRSVLNASRTILAAIFILRLKKHLANLQFLTYDEDELSRLPEEEREILEFLREKVIEILEDKIGYTLFRGTPSIARTDMALVYFTSSYKAFRMSDLKVRGPFREEDVALIPLKDAIDLQRKGIVHIYEKVPLGKSEEA